MKFKSNFVCLHESEHFILYIFTTTAQRFSFYLYRVRCERFVTPIFSNFIKFRMSAQFCRLCFRCFYNLLLAFSFLPYDKKQKAHTEIHLYELRPIYYLRMRTYRVDTPLTLNSFLPLEAQRKALFYPNNRASPLLLYLFKIVSESTVSRHCILIGVGTLLMVV